MARGQHSMGELAALDRYMPISGAPPISALTGMEHPAPMGVHDMVLHGEVPAFYEMGAPMHGYPEPYAAPEDFEALKNEAE